MKEPGAQLTLINGLTPEQYMKIQNAAKAKVRKKNRIQYLYYAAFIAVLALLASTTFQYVLTVIIASSGGPLLWYSQNAPSGPDDGIPRTRGMPPLFALLIFLLLLVITIGSLGLFIYKLAA